MKKILAIILSLVMAFSIAAIPASAIDASIDDAQVAVGEVKDDASAAIDSAKNVYDSIKAEDYSAAIDGMFDFASKLAKAIHSLVHSLSEMFDFDCPFCDGTAADDDSAAGEEEAPRAEGAAFVVDGTSQTTFGGEEYYGDIFISATSTVSEIMLLSITADVNNVVVLEAENTVVFSGGNFTLPEGGKLVVDTTDTITQVMFSTGDIIVNGEVLTEDNVAQYVEGVEWPWFY